MPHLHLLGSNFETPLPYLKSALSHLPYSKCWCKHKKSLNLEPEMPVLRVFGLEFENNIVILEISVLEFFLLQGLVQK